MKKLLPKISIYELQITAEAIRAGSIREVSRRYGITPAGVSRIISAVETKVERKIFDRSSQGVTPTSDANKTLEQLNKIIEATQNLIEAPQISSEKCYQVATLTWLNRGLISHALGDYAYKSTKIEFQITDLPSDEMVPWGLKRMIDMACYIGQKEWPSSWEQVYIGTTKWVLCAGNKLEVPNSLTSQEVLQGQFVVPSYFGPYGAQRGIDFCPEPIHRRKVVAQVGTAESALEFIKNTNYFAFVPEILVTNRGPDYGVKIIKVLDWPPVEQEIYLACHAESMAAKDFHQISDLIKDRLKPKNE